MASPGQPQSAPPGDPLQPPVGDRDVTRHHQTLYNPQWETVTSHGIARAATKCPPPETLYNPRWETVT